MINQNDQIISDIIKTFSLKIYHEKLFEKVRQKKLTLKDLFYLKDDNEKREEFGNFFTFLEVVKEISLRVLLDRIKNSKGVEREKNILDYLKILLAHEKIENIHILFFDKNKKLIKAETHGKGTISYSSVYIREVVKKSIDLDASFIILSHNHPSGNSTPSKSDIDLTYKLKKILNIFNIKIEDHIVIGKIDQTSFKEKGFLEK